MIVQTSNAGADGQVGRITVQNDIDKTAGGDATLTLLAHESIVSNNVDITSTSGRLNLVFNADSDATGGGAINLANGIFDTNGGSIVMGGGVNPLTTAAIGTSAHNDGITLNNIDLITNEGNISMRGTGRLGGGGADEFGVYLTGGSTIQTTTGDISLVGIGGDTNRRNYGVYLTGATTNISTDTGAVTLTGIGGGTNNQQNYGVYINNASIDSTGSGAGDIRLTGTAGPSNTTSGYGIFLTGGTAAINSASGDIYLTGVGDGNGSGSNNFGVYLRSGASLNSIGTGLDAARILVDGTGGGGRDNNHGAYFDNGDISSIDGDIRIDGQGADARRTNAGVYLRNGSVIDSTGLATVTLDGQGGDGERQNYGVYLNGGTTAINTIFGDLNITGRGGNGTNYRNYGILINGGADIASTGTGANAARINMDGQGGNGTREDYGLYISGGGTTVTSVDGDMTYTGVSGMTTGDSNRGIILNSGASVSSTGVGTNAANITFNATSQNGGRSNNYGMQLGASNAAIDTVDGDIVINTIGGDATRDNNYGLYMYSGGKIRSTGVGPDAGTITINATGGDGRRNNHGFYMRDNGTLISSIDGAIDIDGNAGNGTQYRNRGVFIERSADILSTGTGVNAATIDITGVGGNGSYENYGVFINSNGTTINSVDGAINIEGRGGNSTAQRNYGFYMAGSARINSTGTTPNAATIDISGTAGNGAYENYGVYLNGGNTRVTSAYGAIDILGQGGTGTSHRNYGVYLVNSPDIISTGTGVGAATIDLIGIGGSGTGNNDHGIYLNNSQTAVQSIDGDITVSGTSGLNGSTNHGILMYRDSRLVSNGNAGVTLTAIGDGTAEDFRGYDRTPRVGGPSAAGDIVINVDSLRLDNNMRFQTTGEIILQQRTDTTTIGLGSGTGDITLTNVDLSSRFLNASKLTFGSQTASSTVDIDGLNVASEVEIRGGDIDITGGGLTSTGGVTLRALNDVNITADVTANDFFDASAGRDLNFTSGTLNSVGYMTLNASRDISNTMDINATGDILATADRDININAGTMTSVGTLTMDANRTINITADINAGSDTMITAGRGANLTSGTIVSGGFLDIDVGGDVNLATTINTVGDTQLSSNGNISISGPGLSSGGAVELAGNNINIVGDITANSNILFVAENDLTALGTMGTPITIDSNGDAVVFVADNRSGRNSGVMNINRYVTVNSAPDDFRVYGVNAQQVTIEGMVNALAMTAALPKRIGNYNPAHTGYGVFYEPLQLPDTVIRTTYRKGGISKPQYGGGQSSNMDVVIDGIDAAEDAMNIDYLLKIHADLAPFFADWTYVQSVNYKLSDFKESTSSFAFINP